MIHQDLLVILSIMFIVSMLTILSKRLKVSYPILLVVAGLLISLIPGLPPLRLHPDIVFLIFLPPLLFFAAWNTSWKSFWEERRRINLLAFGLVIITSGGIVVSYFQILSQTTLPETRLSSNEKKILITWKYYSGVRAPGSHVFL